MPQPIKEEDLKTITKKVYALYAKHGIDGISMDEVSRQTGISKATLYRYFTSKEDIVRGMVDFLVARLDSVQFTSIGAIEDVISSLQDFYEKSVLVEALSGSRFLPDLEHKFPETYQRCIRAMEAMQDRFGTFYRQAVDKGFCRDLPFPLISRQFRRMLPCIINMDYLEENDLTLPQAVRAYDRMFLCQILTEEYLYVTDQEEIYDFAEHLSTVLRQDFFIDSIRR